MVNAGESREDQIVAAYADGEDVEAIAARFASDPREIEQIVAVTAAHPLAGAGPGRFNPPPGWPPAPAGWFPPPGWRPDRSWPPAPPGWQIIVDDAAAGPPPAQPAEEPDLLDQLRRPGDLRLAGVVTEEEFAAKKAEILARL